MRGFGFSGADDDGSFIPLTVVSSLLAGWTILLVGSWTRDIFVWSLGSL